MFFFRHAQVITSIVLLVQAVGIVAYISLIYRHNPAPAIMFGGYVLFNSFCSMSQRLFILLLVVVSYAVIEHAFCDWRGSSIAWERIGYTAAIFVLSATGMNMQEHLEHHANFYTRKVIRRIDEINATKNGSSKLLGNLLPAHVVELVNNNVSPIAEPCSDVTIIFTDIKGFTAYSSKITPMEVVEFLNSMYSAFDEIIINWGLHKVEIIGDAYFIASGCPKSLLERTPGENAMRAVEVALALLRTMPAVCEDPTVQMRVGIHTGDVIAGVVGKKGPRYQLFGPTVEYANLMESNGVPGKVHISNDTYQLLMQHGHSYDCEERQIDLQGNLQRTWLVYRSKSKAARRLQKDMTMKRASVLH